MKKNILFVSMMCVLASKSQANVRPHSIFSDNMVIQRNMEVPIWGWADEGEKVTVEFAGQTQTTITQKGKWRLKLQPLKENQNPQSLVIKGNNTITINNVLVGEVWITSGQSNMEWALARSTDGEAASANSTNNLLRIYNVPHSVKMKPDTNINAKWVTSEPKTTKQLSAVGYWFLSKLQKELNVPVGFVNVAFGGTVIESWMSKEVLESMPFKDKNLSVDSMLAEYNVRLAKFKPIIDAYERAKDSTKRLGLPNPPRPAQIPSEFKGTTTIYNGEIAPLAPFAVKGIAWYQGESNAYVGRANSYIQLLPAMIELWRKNWERKDLPFIIIQLSGDRKMQTEPVEKSGVEVIREAQLKTSQKIANTVLVTTHDCGELDVHYKLKQPIGERVCNAALALAYGKNIEFTGPLYQSFKIEKEKVILTFTHANTGLVIKTDTVKPSTLYGFAIAGEDKKFYWADAKIEGNKVVVSSSKVPTPVSVRYGWASFSNKWNLYNKEGYPASSFRTDDWELPLK